MHARTRAWSVPPPLVCNTGAPSVPCGASSLHPCLAVLRRLARIGVRISSHGLRRRGDSNAKGCTRQVACACRRATFARGDASRPFPGPDLKGAGTHQPAGLAGLSVLACLAGRALASSSACSACVCVRGWMSSSDACGSPSPPDGTVTVNEQPCLGCVRLDTRSRAGG